MSKKNSLTETQRAVLTAAVDTHGTLDVFPANLRGGARSKVLGALVEAGLVRAGAKGHTLTTQAYVALGIGKPQARVSEKIDTPRQAASAVEASTTPRTRANSKQAQVIDLLKRPEGATIAQVRQATGWQAHTVRGTFAGAFRKRLGLNVISEKPDNGERVYRIA